MLRSYADSVRWLMASVVTLMWFATLIGPAAALDVKVTAETLDNGMKVIVIPDRRAPVVTHMVWYRVGSADEELGKSGIAHYLEHLLFKGTDRLKPGEFSRIIRENGGEDNAFTSYDFTAYYERLAKDRLELVMDLGANRMGNLKLTETDVKTELEVVKEERRSRTDNNPSALLREQVSAATYTAHPYGRPIIGWMPEVERLTAEDAMDFYRKYYTPSNAALIVAGDVEPEEVVALAEKYYGVLENTADTPVRQRTREPEPIAAKRIHMEDPRASAPFMMRTYIVPGMNQAASGESEALDVLSHIVGAGSSSLLYRKLVTAQGVASRVSAWYNGDVLDGAEFNLSLAPTPGTSIEDAEAALDQVLAEVASSGVNRQEVERAKRRLVASSVYAIDSQFRLAYLFGVAFATGQSVDLVKGWSDRIKAVTPAQVAEVARKYLRVERSTTGVLVPGPSKAARAQQD